ncbi:Vacuolar fusion protein CCZ1-like protein B [Bienertia sinuspersici]
MDAPQKLPSARSKEKGPYKGSSITPSKAISLVNGKGQKRRDCMNRGNLRGLGLWWRGINAHILSYSMHHIAAEIKNEENETIWMVVAMYGWPEHENKWRTWELMKSLKNGSSVPVLFFGDFNEIICETEKEGGAVRRDSYMEAFREAIDDCGLCDLGYCGNKERLERFLADGDWCNNFPNARVKHFSIYRSDHAPILFDMGGDEGDKEEKRRFHFEALWLYSEECEGVVKEAWENYSGEQIHE